MVIQDRMFNPDGSFRYPTSDIPGATWIGEYFGDVMLVNGKSGRISMWRGSTGCGS